MILIVGSTGLLGSEICRLLRAERKDVRALIRPTSEIIKVEKLKSYGTELVYGDLKDSSSLSNACSNIDTIISTATSIFSTGEEDTIKSVDLNGQLSLINSAKTAGVKRFIFFSFPRNAKINFPLADAKQKVENYLKESGITYTIIQANLFMETWLSPAFGFNPASRTARTFGAGYDKVKWVSYFDVAKIAVRSISDVEMFNKAIQVGGPQSLSQLDVIKIFEMMGRKSLRVENISELTLRAELKNATDPLKASITGLSLMCASGIETNIEFMKHFHLELTTVTKYAERMLTLTQN